MSLAPTVRTMDLSKNQLTAIPVALGNFTELKQLNAEHNEIGRLCVQQAIIHSFQLLKWNQSQVKIQGGWVPAITPPPSCTICDESTPLQNLFFRFNPLLDL